MSNRNFSIHKFTIALGNICTYYDRGCPSIKYIFIQFFIFFLFSQLLVKEICFVGNNQFKGNFIMWVDYIFKKKKNIM